ncbi:MAG: LD-carboxypeptidase [Planctomycetes bacterium]|nr:LD-carboxypeptidase [Planctomycetota bacterium]
MSDKTACFFTPAYGISTDTERKQVHENCQKLATSIRHLAIYNDELELTDSHQWCHGTKPNELRKLFNNNILWPIRGGYGCINWAHELQALDAKHAPYLIGYSDISIFHAIWRNKSWGESCYGIMPGPPFGQRSLNTLQLCISGDKWALDQSSNQQCMVISAGESEGLLQAYCLRVLCSLIGTPYMPNLDQTLLAIEDIDEKPYALDRDLNQLYHAGCLNHLRALICGRFPCELSEDYNGPGHRDVLHMWAKRLQIPVLYGLPFGHEKDPICLPSGRLCSLQCSQDQWTLSFAARV